MGKKRKHTAFCEWTREELVHRTRKRILAVVAICLVFLVLDRIQTGSHENIPLFQSKEGVYLLRPETGSEAGYFSLRASVTGGSEEFEKRVNVKLAPYGQESALKEGTDPKAAGSAEMEQQRLEHEIGTIVRGINSDRTARKVFLPSSLETGEKISWAIEGQSHAAIILFGTASLAVVIYRSRFSPLEKRRREREESVIRQLPEFVNRLVLLLNAGMVLNSAFEKTIEEGISFHDSRQDYFDQRMKEIYASVKTANGMIHLELRRFARESGIKELIRISNIINDNVGKGVALTQKLQSESELLWMNRKKNCEERGRIAETKLTLPLVIFLMVLIVIVVAPALLEL